MTAIKVPMAEHITTQKLCNWFILQSTQAGKPLSPVKLNHLAILTNWWYLHRHGEFLLNESVEAWEKGPVLPTIYHEYKDESPHGIIEHPSRRQPAPEPEELEALGAFLQYIWTLYGKYTAQQLARINTAPTSPWNNARGKHANAQRQHITQEHVVAYFKALGS